MSPGGAAGPVSSGGAPAPVRLALVDAVRGAAIIGVVIYHFFWDLSYFWLIPVDVSTHPAWLVFARALLGSFILLVGVSVVLAHGEAIRWRAFWRRFLVVAGAALLVSAGTYALFPDSFVYFGVLHAIALFSLIGLLGLKAPLALVFLVGGIIVVAPLVLTDPIFTARALSWIGFWRIPPPTNDLVPVFPWLGVTLIGVGLTRLARERGWLAPLSHWQARGTLGRGLVLAGRWSLVIYLVHQPLLLAIIYPLSGTVLAETASRTAFTRTCEAGCTATGSDAAWCVAYCGCALAGVERDDLWDAVESPTPSEAQSRAVSELVLACSLGEDFVAPDDVPVLEQIERLEP